MPPALNNTEFVNITVYDEDRNEAAQLANAVAESYRDYRGKVQAERVAKATAAEDRTGRTGLGSGVVRTTGARIDWASLMKRVFREAVLACPCVGRRRVIADIQNSEVIVAILNHLGLPTEAPRIAPARDPTFGFE